MKMKGRFEGFDVLRAIFSLAIVAYKTNVFYIPSILIPSGLTHVLGAYVFSGMVGALAVPVFLQVSLFLFYLKGENAGLSYFLKKRLPRLISLYLFWVGSITVFDILFVGKLESIKGEMSSLKRFLEFIMSGNNTPYFFFFSLIFVTVIAEILILLFSKLDDSSKRRNISYVLLFVLSGLLLLFLSLEPIIDFLRIQLPVLNFLSNMTRWDYNPLNFLPYVFTTAITVQEYRKGGLEKVTRPLKQKLYSLLCLTVLCFVLEVSLTNSHFLIRFNQAPLDHYMRPSLVFGSWLLLYLSLLSKRNVSSIVRFISKCSLGIYGFHVFFTFRQPFELDSIPFLNSLFQAIPALSVIASFSVVLIGSISLTLLFSKVPKIRNFVSV